jgi:glycosyltransferase involved in cell wall biosynthesis
LTKTLTQRIDRNIAWEIIVVDNNSSDHTRQVVRQLQEQFIAVPISYAFESKQGLSHARNRGIACSRGDLVLFTDDDVSPDPDWLKESVAGMLQYGCDAGGGWIGPVWAREKPRWLTERYYGFLALRVDEGEPRLVRDLEQVPFGANMIFCKSVFERFGLFSTDRGRVGKKLWSGEDTDIFARLLKAGTKIMYFPQAKVYHHIDPMRMKKQYFRRWRFQTSCNEATTDGITGRRRIFGVPPYIVWQTLVATYKAMASRFYDHPGEVLHKDMILSHFMGTIYGLLSNRTESQH